MSWLMQNKSKKLLFILIPIAIIAFFLLKGKSHEDVDAVTPGKIFDVNISVVKNSVVPVLRESPGTVRPNTQSDVAAKIMSAVSNVYVREGDHVSAGQILLRLESDDLDTQVAQAAAQLKASGARVSSAYTATELQKAQSHAQIATAKSELDAAREQLAVVKNGPRRQERSQANIAVVEAEAQMLNAEADYNRMQKLFDQDVIPKQKLDSAYTAYNVAKARLASVKEKADLVDEGSRLEDINTAQARVNKAEEALRLAQASVVQNKIKADEARMATAEVSRASASLDYARVMKKYSIVRSPISGLVTGKMVDPGDMVQPGVILFTIEDNRNYRLESAVPEEYARSIFPGKQVKIRIDAASNKWMSAKVTQVIPSSDTNSRTFVVKANIPAGFKVRTGEFGRMQFDTEKKHGLFIPASAVVIRNGLTGVFIADNGIARFRIIKIDKSANTMVQILSGLDDGSSVIISDTSFLADGVPVRVKE